MTCSCNRLNSSPIDEICQNVSNTHKPRYASQINDSQRSAAKRQKVNKPKVSCKLMRSPCRSRMQMERPLVALAHV